MKKLFLILLIIAMLTGCSAKNDNTAKTDKETTENENIESPEDDSAENEPEVESEPEAESEPEKLELVDGDFRNSSWGDSKEDVIAIEGTPDLEDDEGITYIKRFNSEDYLIFFDFNNNSLYKGVYMPANDLYTAESYLYEYNTIKRKLIEKYGELDYNDKVITNSNAKHFDEDESQLRMGYVHFLAEWETENTEIALFLANKKDYSFLLKYESKTIEAPPEKNNTDL